MGKTEKKSGSQYPTNNTMEKSITVVYIEETIRLERTSPSKIKKT